jgi:hypothetical protein
MGKWSAWKPWEIIAFGGLAVAGLTVAVKILAAPEGEGDWEEFKAKNHCVSVAQERGGRTAGWRCDDGEIHYRWRQQQ